MSSVPSTNLGGVNLGDASLGVVLLLLLLPSLVERLSNVVGFLQTAIPLDVVGHLILARFAVAPYLVVFCPFPALFFVPPIVLMIFWLDKLYVGLSVFCTRDGEQLLLVHFSNLTVECSSSTCCHQCERSLVPVLSYSGNQSSDVIPDTQVRSYYPTLYQSYHTTPDSQSEFLAKVIS